MAQFKIILTFILSFCVSILFAQQYTPMTAAGYAMKRVKVDSTLHLPSFCGIPTLRNSTAINGALAMDTCNNKLYKWTNQSGWSVVGQLIDTSLYVKYTDTSSMLSKYLRKSDTASLSNRIDLRVKYTDTAAMLSPYLHNIDTTNKWVNNIVRTPGKDSIIYYIGSTRYAIKDSVGSGGGGGQNGRFGNDTATIVMIKVHNDAGTTLTNGEVVYLATSGTNSDAPSVKRAKNTGDATSANTFGFVSGSIPNNDTGYVIISGKIEKLNTAAYSNGMIIYLDSIAGKWTSTKPKAPYHLVYLGGIVKSNAENGAIMVKPQNGYELDEIHDVQITTPLNNQIIVYSDTQSIWKNRSVYTIVDTASFLSPYQRANNAVTLSTTQTITGQKTFNPSVTASSLIARGTYFTPSLTAAANNDTLVGLDIKPTFANGAFTGVSNYALRSNGIAYINRNSSATNGSLYILNSSTTGSNNIQIGEDFTTNYMGFGWYPSGSTTYNSLTAKTAYLYILTGASKLAFNTTSATQPITFATNDWNEKMRIFGGGNVIIGGGNTPTDAGYKLDVNGTGRFQSGLTGTIANFSGNAAFGTTQIGIGGSGGFGGGASYWVSASSPHLTLNTSISGGGIQFIGSVNSSNTYAGASNALSTNTPVQNFSAGITSYYNQIKSTLNATGNASANTMYVRGFYAQSGTLTPNSTTLIPIGFENESGTNLLNSTSGATLIGGQYGSLVASAKLQVTSTTQGFLPPRMTTTQRTAIVSPAEGLIVYDLTLHKLYVWDGTAWQAAW